jgi:hypothetical protein
MSRAASFLLALGVVFQVALCRPDRAGADIVQERDALAAEYRKQLDELAIWCAERKLDDAAKQLKTWLPERHDDQLTLFVLADNDAASANAEAPQAEWQKRWQELRDAQADRLFDLARRALNEHRPSIAAQLVTETVRENPDHKLARRWLGYVKSHDAWRTPFEVRQLNAGKVCHEKFGWLPKAQFARYEQGQRHFQGRWMSAADEAALRADIKRGWRVESAHYVVTTNHSLEEGVRLSGQLEALRAIWQQVFIEFTHDPAELRRRFDGKALRADPRPHNVVYYRTRQEYNEALRAAQPKIDITLGIYLDKARTAYFFAGEDQDPGTLFHEATHQLFQESRPAAADVGHRDNFWIVEGIACYMESLAEHGAYYTLGGSNSGRVPAARHRLLEDNFYVPLAELVPIGMSALQHDPRIARLYSQSAGLADFLMHVDRGRYREALVRYLSAIYSGRATNRTLSELCGTSYETLDRQYRDFMSQDATSQTTSAATSR